MTVPTSTAKSGPYAGAGTTGPFTVGFRFLENSHLQVIRTSSTGVDTTLALTTDYSASGAGGTTGSVTLVAALAVGQQLTIIRNVPFTQDADYVQNDAFPAESHERALDKLTMQTQQLLEAVDRAAKLPVTSVADSEELVADITLLADNIVGLTAVYTAIPAITVVANDLSEPVSEINTVATSIANVDTVGTNISSVNTVAGIDANVTTVAGIAANVSTVAGISPAVSTVAGISGAVSTVSGINAAVSTVSGNTANIDTVAAVSGNVTTVAGSIAAVNTNATNIVAIQNASANADAAALSATDAATSLDLFKKAYQGAFAGDPATRYDGSALQTGDIAYNTLVSKMRVYATGTGWQDVGVSFSPVAQVFTGTGSQTVFTLSASPGVAAAVIVSVGGVVQKPTVDYTVSGTTLTFLSAPPSGTDNISAINFGVAGVVNVPAANSVATASLQNAAVTYAKMQSVTAGKLLGRDTSGAGVVQELPIAVDASGNVGIGTSSPQKALNVVASSSSTTLGSSTAVIQVGNSSGAAFGVNAGLELFGSGAPSAGLGNRSAGIYGLYESFNGSGNAGALVFATNPAGAVAVVERARIDSSGILLVNTASAFPGEPARLQVNGNAATALALKGGTNNYLAAFFNTSNAFIGSITGSAGTSTAYNTSSDYRLKDTIAPMTGALAKVALLKPCTYKWKSDGSDGQGFIAHELAEVEPGCVTGEKDAVDAEGKPQYQGIDTSFLVATLAAAIQEQQALITSLTTRLTALEQA